MNEHAWEKADTINSLIQREPKGGAPASEPTNLMIVYDDDNLYFGIRCFDSQPDKIVANEMRRDNYLLNNDAIELFIDTFHDHRNGFYFSVNPLGAKRDGLITAGINEEMQNFDWDGIWDCSAAIDEFGWTAEIQIPFRTLRFSGAEKQEWGFNFSRIIPRYREEAYWAPVSREFGFAGKFRMETYGHITGLDSLSQPDRFQVKPFLLTGIQRDFEEENVYDKKLEIGLDAKYLVSTNLALDLTLNTDFAQVEADQEQVNLTRFELFFPEKREFFLEGAAMFRAGENSLSPFYLPTILFFSRRIGLSEDNKIIPIIGGVKLTGKTGDFDIGMLNILTDRAEYLDDDDQLVNEPMTNYSAIRLKNDFSPNSYFGVIGLNKESMDNRYYNRTFGADVKYYLNEKINFNAFAAKTSAPGISGNDWAFSGDISYGTDFLTVQASQNSIEENFNPEMGFAPRTDIRTTHLNVMIAPRPDFLGIRQTYIFNDFYYYAKQNGALDTRQNYLGMWNSFQSGAYFFAMLINNFEAITDEFEIHDDVIIKPADYSYNLMLCEFQSDQSRAVSGKINFSAGQFYDGHITGFGAGTKVRIGNRFAIDADYAYNNVRLSAGKFSTNLLGFRFLYTFSPKMFLKAFIQWNSSRNVVISNLLFNFIHTPGSDLYFVYNEELNTSGKSLKSKVRTVLLKFTYLFNF